ncbi:hypothetical protein C0584_04270 [Candidatus Parcubacteria bacterium]|nr:MAG: hypothetical protein C0584_04270 [Candidatus Parcubacteria bacterium]
MEQADFQSIGDLFSKKKDQKKPPAHEWQDLALRIIQELKVPNFKRNSVFKVCKENSKQFIETCLSDTKELCKTGSKWSYFFKLVSLGGKPKE